jgi:8-oxo-dGTP diphosphatase
MKETTLCLCIRDGEVLLAMKKRGFGMGKWNGPGGKIDAGETPEEAMVREAREELSIEIAVPDLKKVAVINFYFDGEHKVHCHVFVCRLWNGEPQETEEMKPQWFALDKLPYSEMWIADSKWIPEVLSGRTILAEVKFNKKGNELLDLTIEDAAL